MIFASITSLQNQDQDQNQKPGVRWQWGTAQSDRGTAPSPHLEPQEVETIGEPPAFHKQQNTK